jgi:hypothetical protein
VTYNWQTADRSSFLSWLIPTALSDEIMNDTEISKQLSEATEKFTKVDLVLEISGVRVSGEKLFTHMYELMEREMKQEAARYVESLPEREKIREAEDAVTDILKEAHREIKRTYAAAGVVFPHEDW